MDQSNKSHDLNNTFLMQDHGIKQYTTWRRRIGQQDITSIKFNHMGLTVILSTSHPQTPPNCSGNANLAIYRKFLPDYGKFLHYVIIAFSGSDTKLKVQVLLTGRLTAGLQMIQRGCAAAFTNPPFRPLRIPSTKRKRTTIRL